MTNNIYNNFKLNNCIILTYKSMNKKHLSRLTKREVKSMRSQLASK